MNLSDLEPSQLAALLERGVLPESLKEQIVNDNRVNPHIEPVAVEQESPAPAFPPQQEDVYNQQPTRDKGFDFKDPIELLFFLDEGLALGRANGGYDLYPWQEEFMVDFAAGGKDHEHPFQALVRAANGSGKDKIVIAACCVWLAMRYLRALAVVTTASGNQLDTQTCKHIGDLCAAANRKIHPKCWKINYRHFLCNDTGSPVHCFATDEPGKAEGYHPLDYGRKMALFMSEAKTVPDDINVAYNKCTGYTHRVHASTPGLPMGHFYDACNLATPRVDIKDIGQVDPTQYVHYHVTAYQCAGHLSKSYIEQMKRDLPGGELGAAFKSQVLAEFGTTDEMVVIPGHFVTRCAKNDIKWLSSKHNKAGLDLSDGGDETVLSIRNGNKLVKLIPFRFDNTEDTITFLDKTFREYDLNHPESLIFADAGGLGKPMLNRLVRMGWHNIRFVLNNERAHEWRTYTNRGTEMWFNVRRLFEGEEIGIVYDAVLIKQLSTRYYKMTNKNTHQLLSKPEQKSRGYPSPDRADSVVLAFSDYKSKVVVKQLPEEQLPFKLPEDKKPVNDFSIAEWSKRHERNQGYMTTHQFGVLQRDRYSQYKDELARINQSVIDNKQPVESN